MIKPDPYGNMPNATNKPLVTWKNVFNSNFRFWGRFEKIQEAAEQAGYPYFLWNDRVYRTAKGTESGCTMKDLE